MRVAVTGAGGRLGRAVLAALADAPFTGIAGPLAWRRPDYDLDDPGAPARLIARDRPEVIVHAAAWTDVDGCTRDPDAAMRRNGEAVGYLARAASAAGVDLILVSTNEVFDGQRTDGRGYGPDDTPGPINAYGASKLAGELAAATAFGWMINGYRVHEPQAKRRPALAIVRTAWLFGPPGNDFPEKIARAAQRARAAGTSLRVVGDEIGSPTLTDDLAEAIVALIGAGVWFGGIHHITNSGAASRAAWARAALGGLDIEVELEEVPSSTWARASEAPAWAVLEATDNRTNGEPLRSWQLALDDYLPALRRQLARSPS